MTERLKFIACIRLIMANVEDTKHRLLREAVQDNINIVTGARVRRSHKRGFAFHAWLWGLLLVGGLGYLIMPSQVVSKGNTGESPGPQLIFLEEPPDSTNILFSKPAPLNRDVLPLGIKRIVIDPGHGGNQPGAIAESGLTEKEVVLDVAKRLKRLMADDPFEIVLTRESDRTMSLDKRVAFANEKKADLFVSVHVNWMEPREVRALETYYVGPTDDPATLKLAKMENRDSGYSLNDYKKILEKIYIDTRRDESHALARSMQRQLFGSLKTVNPALENRGVKTAPFVVLIGTQMPAILVEICCLSNDEEVKLLTKTDYREKIAEALRMGVYAYSKNLNVAYKKGN